MNLIDLIALLAILQLFVFSMLVGRARGRYGVKAPAMTGHDVFERTHRVHMNSLELIVVFLPALYLAARHSSTTLAAVCGVVYLIGRVVYATAYIKSPASRSLGFILSSAPVTALIIAALIGLVPRLF
jgi:uncharacterized membrane protein YecN with MAPEG domain